MQKLMLVPFFIFFGLLLKAQAPLSISKELNTINSVLVNAPTHSGKGNLISNRAMNIFLANKAGYFLAESDNLSLYKNSVIYNAAEGIITVNHNLYQPKGIDESVRSFLTVGAKANVADAFSAASSGRQFNNQLGFFCKQTWIGKSNTHFTANSSGSLNQKNIMDALRAAILHTLETEINNKVKEFEVSIEAIDPAHEVPGLETQIAKDTIRKKFLADLQAEYEFKFASLQSETMINTLNYKCVNVNWTSISVYVPLLTKYYTVAPSLTGGFADKHPYPLQITISHTKFYENSKYGKLFLTIGGGVYSNNTRESYGLDKTTFSDYKNGGGTDTLQAAKLEANGIYIGYYESFFTPLLKGQVVFLPTNWHFGISCTFEQNIGKYNPLNARIGIPIVLINKQAEPAINFEFQVRFFDITGKINPERVTTGKTSIGLTIGIPFSKIAY